MLKFAVLAVASLGAVTYLATAHNADPSPASVPDPDETLLSSARAGHEAQPSLEQLQSTVAQLTRERDEAEARSGEVASRVLTLQNQLEAATRRQEADSVQSASVRDGLRRQLAEEASALARASEMHKAAEARLLERQSELTLERAKIGGFQLELSAARDGIRVLTSANDALKAEVARATETEAGRAAISELNRSLDQIPRFVVHGTEPGPLPRLRQRVSASRPAKAPATVARAQPDPAIKQVGDDRIPPREKQAAARASLPPARMTVLAARHPARPRPTPLAFAPLREMANEVRVDAPDAREMVVESYTDFVRRPHQPGIYELPWGTARLRAGSDGERGGEWEFIPSRRQSSYQLERYPS